MGNNGYAKRALIAHEFNFPEQFSQANLIFTPSLTIIKHMIFLRRNSDKKITSCDQSNPS